MGIKRISETKVREIVRDYQSGRTEEEVAARHGVSKSSVGNALARKAISTREPNSYRKISQDVRAAIARDYQAGELEVLEIARKYGVSRYIIDDVRKSRSLSPRRRRVTSEQLRRVASYCRFHKSVAQAAKRFRVSKTTVYRIMHAERIARRGVRRRFFDESFFKKKDETTAYWMGFLWADGCLSQRSKNSWSLALRLEEKDLPHLRWFCGNVGVSTRFIAKCTAKGGGRKKPSNQVEIALNHTCFATWLRPWGIVPRKTYRFVAPRIAKRLYAAYLRGWFDGDGYMGSRKDSGEFNAVLVAHQEDALRWYSNALREIGFIGKTTVYHHSTQTGGYWSLHISRKKDILQFADVLHVSRGLHLERKWGPVLERPREFFERFEVTKEVVQEWKERCDSGESYQEIADQLPISPSTVRLHVTRAGGKSRYARPSEADRREMVRLYIEEGLSQTAIAERFGKSQASVRYALDARRVEPRARNTCRRIPAEIGLGMKVEYDKGKSIKEVARLFGLGASGTRKALLRAGAKMRPRAGGLERCNKSRGKGKDGGTPSRDNR